METSLNLRFAQLSDLHLLADKNTSYHQINPYQSFQKVIQAIKALDFHLDFLLLTGDLADKQEKEVYFYVDELLKPLNIPFYWIGGNHDNTKIMDEIASQLSVRREKSFEVKGVQVILLNSVEPTFKESYGILSQEESTFLENELKKSGEKPVVIALHHHPVAVNCAYMDELMLKDSEKFLDILDKYPNIEAVIFGHIHNEIEILRNNILFLSCPSTCVQFKMTETFAIDDLPSGYKIITMDRNGSMFSDTRWVK